jgi:hypothetical protein
MTDFSEKPHGIAGRPGILDGIAGSGILPGGDRISSEPANNHTLSGQHGHAEHGPHEGIVRYEPGNNVGRLGPRWSVADHHC